MIHKNAIYGNIENVVVVEFNGDVLVLNFTKTETNSVHVLFQSSEVEYKPNINVKVDKIFPEIVFIFQNPASIDAIINKLLEARTELTK